MTSLKKIRESRERIHSQEFTNAAKAKIFDANKSVSEIAYELGFKYRSILQGCLSNTQELHRRSIEVR